MSERLIADWPPLLLTQEKYDVVMLLLFETVRSHLLTTLQGIKRMKVQSAHPDQFLCQICETPEGPKVLELEMGIFNGKNKYARPHLLEDNEVMDLINCVLLPSIRKEMAQIVVWDYAAHIEQKGVEETCGKCDLDELLWKPEQPDIPSQNGHTLENRANVLQILDEIDEETGLRELYISLVFGRYEGNNEF